MNFSPASSGASSCSSFSPSQTQILGERLFELIMLISPSRPELTGNITGMLLELGHSKVRELLRDNDLLKNKVEEVISLLDSCTDRCETASPSGSIFEVH